MNKRKWEIICASCGKSNGLTKKEYSRKELEDMDITIGSKERILIICEICEQKYYKHGL